MDNQFFEHPILNSPYDYPSRYWELDETGQPTQRIIESRRRAEFIMPFPKPRRRAVARLVQAQDNTPIRIDLIDFQLGEDSHHIAGNAPVIDGPCLIQHDVRIGFQAVACRDPKT